MSHIQKNRLKEVGHFSKEGTAKNCGKHWKIITD